MLILVINDKIKKFVWEELKEINLKLWDIENSKRLCEKNLTKILLERNLFKLKENVHFMNDKY